MQPQSHRSCKRAVKRRSHVDVQSLAKRSSSCGLDPVVVQSTRPWPVFTVAHSELSQAATSPCDVDSPRSLQRPRKLQARTVVQHCTHAKVKLKPAMNGTDAQWAEIQEGMVVYICFFQGATEAVVELMATRLLTAKLFRKGTRPVVSILDLPGSILFIPQDSLLGEPMPRGKMQYKGRCEPWWGAQLYGKIVSACRERVSGSPKCTKAGVKVEQGVYGQKQETVLTSEEPLTHLLEF
ncbi:D-aminoacyl-tRNA deacylase 2-like [Thalassophryne amazonica]|uniref:D-aminoacyl-tRNA deacylase 2-like n=1 Tax=Thalassophryne amazonica TaxID=390379 RepID=UPI001470893B|nr:D-aminoacyl-tRNA deacylase 2-like [Thalassophryne amazonica]